MYIYFLYIFENFLKLYFIIIYYKYYCTDLFICIYVLAKDMLKDLENKVTLGRSWQIIYIYI